MKEALNILQLPISGVILDDKLVKLRQEDARDSIIKTSKNCGCSVVSLEDVKKQKNAVIVVKNDKGKFNEIVEFFEKKQINCRLFRYKEIKSSAIVDGKTRVINRAAYLKGWPWFFDTIMKDLPLDKKMVFKTTKVVSSVISNGNYYHYADTKNKYARFTDGFRKVSGYLPLEDQKKYTVTLLGDSRFVNAILPTKMTIASYLQKKLSKNNFNCEVKNFSVEANRIQNQFAMLKSMDIGESDIFICTACVLGQYEDFQIKSADTQMQIRVRVMRDMTEYCHTRGAEIFFVRLPHIEDVPNLTDIERFIEESYGLEYAPDKSYDKLAPLCAAQNVNLIDLTEIIIRTPRESHYVDANHFSPDGCKCIADTFYRYVKGVIEKDIISNEEIDKLTQQAYKSHKRYVVESRFKGLTEYIQSLETIAKGKPENCGAIVMNCNPFTLGHRYLIETASAQVEHLYILAVEEDRSVFKFKDRIEMIRRGVADLPNVEVIPSGKFVISSLTFPEYFEKSERQDEAVDTTTDIEIFCAHIAPALHIKTRFVGEEPLDRVTNQYNMCMKKMLPEYGIDIKEIKRKESGEAPISASRVRKLLAEKKYEEVQTLVPKTTYDYLIQVLGY